MYFCILLSFKIMPIFNIKFALISVPKLAIWPNKFVLYDPPLMLYGSILNVGLFPWDVCLSSPWDACQLSLLLLFPLSSKFLSEIMPIQLPSLLSSKSVPHSPSSVVFMHSSMSNYHNPWSSKEIDNQYYIFPSWDHRSWLDFPLSSLKSLKWPTLHKVTFTH